MTPLLAEALVWVSVPNVQAGAKTEIWLYSGNKKAAPTADAKGTYDPDTLLVYHFNERGTPSLDSSVWANNALSVAQPAEGSIIGTGLRLDGNTAADIAGITFTRSGQQRAVRVVDLAQASRDPAECRAL